MRDIESRRDIERVLSDFYQKAFADEMLGYIFKEIAQLDLIRHLPRITDFWESIVFGKPVYKDNAMAAHFNLNQRYPLLHEHFVKWLELFNLSVREHFAGQNAELMISRAQSIAMIMEVKMQQRRPDRK